jgi:hypothetical protein
VLFLEAFKGHPPDDLFPPAGEFAHEGVLDFEHFPDELSVGREVPPEERGDALQSHTFAEKVLRVRLFAAVVFAVQSVLLTLAEETHFLQNVSAAPPFDRGLRNFKRLEQWRHRLLIFLHVYQTKV